MPLLTEHAVVVPRGDVQFVATEYGLVNLFGKTLQERVMALVSIAHPDFRDELFAAAKDMGLINQDVITSYSIHYTKLYDPGKARASPCCQAPHRTAERSNYLPAKTVLSPP